MFGVKIIEHKSNGDRNKTLSVNNKIRPYLKGFVNNIKKSDTRKIHFTIAVSFIFSIDNNEEHVMHSKTDNIEIMISDEATEIINEHFYSLKNSYHK